MVLMLFAQGRPVFPFWTHAPPYEQVAVLQASSPPSCVGGVLARVLCSDLTAVHSLFKIQSRQLFFFFLPHLNIFSYAVLVIASTPLLLLYCSDVATFQGYTFLHHKEEHCEAPDFLSWPHTPTGSRVQSLSVHTERKEKVCVSATVCTLWTHSPQCITDYQLICLHTLWLTSLTVVF